MSCRLGVGAEVSPSSTGLASVAVSVAVLAGATALGGDGPFPVFELPRLR
jgi:hypothetical protein